MFLAAFFLILLTTTASLAAVITVPGDFPDLQPAIAAAADGDVIEIAAGTYPAPAGGWTIINADKDFTVRAAAGAEVLLDGGGSRRILRFENTGAGDYSVVFEGLTFVDGFSATDGVGGGVTMIGASATFVDCDFTANTSQAPTTGGGGLFMFDGSEAHFSDCRFSGNTARNEGGALRVAGGSRAYVHRSQFTANRTNIPGHRTSAAGGAIHMTDAQLSVTNSRFDGNEAGCVGAGIYVLGSFGAGIEGTPAAEAWIANSTFVDNLVEPDAAITCSFTPEGGGVHAENDAVVRIDHSRFDNNGSGVGGAVTLYRSTVEITHSTFRGNFATASGTSNFGGAIKASSNDTGADAVNRPSASLTVEDSFFQGAFGVISVPAFKGGCLFAQGDVNRAYGLGGATQNGTPASNRAPTVIRRTVFNDCDVLAQSGVGGTGIGGAMAFALVDLTLEDSLILHSDATGPPGVPGGGGLSLNTESLANVTGTTFAYNSAVDRGGAIIASGSTLNVSGSQFFDNSSDPGSAIYTEPVTFAGNALDVDGVVAANVFSNNANLELREFDNSAGPFNRLRYDDNAFFRDSGADNVFTNPLTGQLSIAELNDLVLHGAAKSQVDNTDLAARPELGALRAAPPELLASHAAGDPPPSGETFVAFAWSAVPGTTVELFGAPLAAGSGVATAGAGVHELAVGGETFVTTVVDAAVPGVAFTADPVSISSGESSLLSWASDGGNFLAASIDRRVANASTPSGSISVSPAHTKTYRLFLVTREGGVVSGETVFVDEEQGLIFADGFESGDTSAWSATSG